MLNKLPMNPENVDTEFDGGDTGCGELLLDLLLFVKRQPPGSVVKVLARDPGAPREMPAWCRMTGHSLLAAEHPSYFIRTKSKETGG